MSFPTERRESPGATGPAGASRREFVVTVAVGCLCLVALVLSARGAPLGVPAADDYLFLHHHRFARVSWLDSDGADWYWRPVSRQLYFGLLGRAMLVHPAAVAVVHALLLLVTYLSLASLARRVLAAPAALVAAAFPLLCEPARVLLAWPSAAQHLIAMAGISSALAAAAAGRMVPALLAELLALGSIESALLSLPLLPLVAPPGARRRWTAAVGGLGLAWFVARLAVAARGVIVPEGMGAIMPVAALKVLFLGLRAQLGLEDLGGIVGSAIAGSLLAVLALGLIMARRRAASARTGSARRSLVWSLAGLLFWIGGTIPLAGVLPNWNAWRTCLPGLGLGMAIAGVLGSAPAGVAAAFLILRAVALIASAPAPQNVSATPARSASDLSFVRLVRLQRMLIGTRSALDSLPRMAGPVHVRYWDFPLLSEYAFAGSRALQVWSDDSTARWLPFGESSGFRDTTSHVLAFDLDSPALVVWIRPAVQDLLRRADHAAAFGETGLADDLLARIPAVQPHAPPRLTAVVLGNRATLALQMGEVGRADSLHRLSAGLVPPREWLRTEIAVALGRRDTLRAVRAANAARRLLEDAAGH